jgi:hypothetical protein
MVGTARRAARPPQRGDPNPLHAFEVPPAGRGLSRASHERGLELEKSLGRAF